MGMARKTRYGTQSDGERKEERKRMKEEHEQRKEDWKQMEK